MNLINVALPNLIATDLVITQPMSSMSGYINYIQYTAGSNKGKTNRGDVLNSPFGLGDVDTDYTSSRVVEEGSIAASATKVNAKWTAVVPGTIDMTVTVTASGTATRYMDDGKGAIYSVPAGTSIARRAVYETEEDGRLSGTEGHVEVTFGSGASAAGTVDYKTGEITLTSAPGASTYVFKYNYNNVVIPQNDIPVINAEVKAMALTARARRVSIYYSQIAAYQAKTDYGMDLGQQLAEKAVGQLSYEIDTEVCQLLIDNADGDGDLVWSKTLPYGVSKQDHYAAFTEIVEIAKQKIYDRTKRLTNLSLAA